MERHEQPRLLQRRVATAPTILPPPTKTQHSGEKVKEEIGSLYSHANAKVISLVALSDQTYSLDSSKRDTVGPWQSHFERTIALGSLRLYRAPGSVAFLSCGSALQPMLPKSQCWCMEDDGSKFILQIRPPSYWRIEIASPDSPCHSLRDCLASILLLDKTPCPFKKSVPILLPPRPLSRPLFVQKWRPWKSLRSYSSELTLAKSSTVCDDNQPLEKGSIKEVITEHKIEPPNKVIQKEDRSHEMESSKVTKGSETPRGTIKVIKVDFSILLEDHPKAIDEPKLPTLCTQYALGLEEGPDSDSSKNTAGSLFAGVGQTSITLERDSMAITKANQAIKPVRPNKKPPDNNECLGTNRGRRHRHTVASSWRDVDMTALVKKTSGDGGMLSIGLNRPKVATTAHETQSKECSEAMMILETALAQGTSQLESYQPHSKLAPQLRLCRKEPMDADNTPTTEAGGCARESSSVDAYSSAYSLPYVLLLKVISTIFQAIFGIVVLGCRTAIIIVVRWWMPVEEIESKTGVPALYVDGHDSPCISR
ncbi:hypothetical protein CRV24_002658 [Beauveria bassiana]|nr:hypothetical protein CRV24_002658 [Beauveria bassiana]